MIRVLIADGQPIFRSGLKQIIGEQNDMTVICEVSNGADLFRCLMRGDGHVLIVDLSIPGVSGLDLLREVKRLRPHLPVLVLSIHPEEQLGMRALRGGAAGYLTRDAVADDVVRAIRTAAAGGKVISAELAAMLADALVSCASRPHETLSDREYEVLRLIGAGETVSEIAERLQLSVKTISTYRARVLEKLRLDNTAQLMRFALDSGVAPGSVAALP